MKIAQLITLIFISFKLGVSFYKELNSEDASSAGIVVALIYWSVTFIVLYYANTFSEIL